MDHFMSLAEYCQLCRWIYSQALTNFETLKRGEWSVVFYDLTELRRQTHHISSLPSRSPLSTKYGLREPLADLAQTSFCRL